MKRILKCTKFLFVIVPIRNKLTCSEQASNPFATITMINECCTAFGPRDRSTLWTCLNKLNGIGRTECMLLYISVI